VHKSLLRLAVFIPIFLVLWFVLFTPVGLLDPGEYDRTTVTAVDANGTELATVEVRIADTRDKRRIGLSRTDSLPPGEGMLFVHNSQDTHAYIMRNMSFALDIVFIDREGRVTTIHHAAVPATGVGPQYRGTARYVLEVERGWANETGLTAGDRIEIPEAAKPDS
jgi:uncharacterized membrane protein (UPF0127 family)